MHFRATDVTDKHRFASDGLKRTPLSSLRPESESSARPKQCRPIKTHSDFEYFKDLEYTSETYRDGKNDLYSCFRTRNRELDLSREFIVSPMDRPIQSPSSIRAYFSETATRNSPRLFKNSLDLADAKFK